MLRTPIYNPGQLQPHELERLFVVRHGELELLRRNLADFASGNGRQHLYLIGRRGMGKTTLLLRLAHLCESEPELAGLTPALLLEEQYGIGDLADFWIEVAEATAATLADPSLVDAAHALRDRLADDPTRLAEDVLALVMRRLRPEGRRLVILLDNFDDVLEALQDEDAEHRLRKELQENREILLVAASARAAEATWQYSAAFYEFLRVVKLGPLDLPAVRRLLAIDDDPEVHGRVERLLDARPERLVGIQKLTGGNPRLVMIARRLLRDSPLGNVRTDLEDLLDDVTPYYKHLIDDIPRAARRVFHALAARWDPARAEDLEPQLRSSRDVIRAQLSKLHREGWLEVVEGAAGRASTYQLASRLFNLYYVMRFRRTQRDRLRHWVLFVEAFYGAPGGHRAIWPMRSRLLIDEAPEHRTDSLRDGLDAAVGLSDDGARGEAWNSLVAAGLEGGWGVELRKLLGGLPEAEREGIERTVAGRYAALRERILAFEPPDGCVDCGEFERLLRGSVSLSLEEKEEWARRLTSLSPQKLRDGLDVLVEEAENWERHLGVALAAAWTNATAAGRLGAGLDHVPLPSQLAEGFPRPAAPSPTPYAALLRSVGEMADVGEGDLMLLAYLAGQSPQSPGAMPEPDKEWFSPRVERVLPRWLAGLGSAGAAVVGRGISRASGRADLAELALRRALEIDPDDRFAWHVLVDVLDSGEPAGDGLDKLVAAARQLVRLTPEDAGARHRLGWILARRAGLFDEAATMFRDALSLDDTRSGTWLELGHVLAWRLKEPAEAEAAYRRSIELGPTTEAWHNLGRLLASLDAARWTEAETALRAAAQLSPQWAPPWRELNLLLAKQPGRLDEAIDACRRRLELDPGGESLNSLAWALYLRGAPEDQADALAHAQQAAELNDESPHFHHTLAAIAARVGDSALALVHMARHLAVAQEKYLEDTDYRRETLDLLVDLTRAGHAAALLPMLDASVVPAFWEPVRVALQVRATGDPVHYTAVAQEIADSARDFNARVDHPDVEPAPAPLADPDPL